MRIEYAYLNREFADPEPYLDDLRALAHSGDFTLGAAVGQFEQQVQAFTGLPYAVGVSNGTDALALALHALGVGPGHEVITAANTFVASAGAIAQVGARPVLVDITNDFTIDPQAIERAITPSTRAVIPVHLTGTLADMPRIMALADAHHLAVVEDAAQAMGATLDGQHAGSWGQAAGISMHPLKMLNVWGDGGLVLTRDETLDRTLRLLRNHGLASRDDAIMFGFNHRLSSLQAVIARRVLRSLPAALARRRAQAATLSAALAGLRGVQTPLVRPGSAPAWATYILRIADDPERIQMRFSDPPGLPGSAARQSTRDALRVYLLERGIDVKVHYPVPLHLQTVGRRLGYHAGACPVAERHAREMLTLPFHEFLTDDELAYMVSAVREFFR